MGRNPATALLWLVSLAVVAMVTGDGGVSRSSARVVSLSGYCESWRANVELNNIRGFGAVPSECSDYVGKYMTSPQYESDVERAAEEALMFLTNKFVAGGDEKDAWVFDVDDTLISTLPYYQKHNYGAVLWCGGDNPSKASLKQWQEGGESPALEQISDLYFKVKEKGLKIFLISSRGESMRDATVSNLIKAGYSGWAELILRCADDAYGDLQEFKAAQRKKLEEQGYRIWGIVGGQWSSLLGHPSAKRTFKLPNPMYYEY